MSVLNLVCALLIVMLANEMFEPQHTAQTVELEYVGHGFDNNAMQALHEAQYCIAESSHAREESLALLIKRHSPSLNTTLQGVAPLTVPYFTNKNFPLVIVPKQVFNFPLPIELY